jgi:tetratricopeptide (TPR) repeat protein
MGRALQRRDSGDADWRRSIGPLRKAIALDPDYGAAYAALAYSEASIADMDEDPVQLERAVADADKAVLLAPDQADGYSVRGYLRIYYTWDWMRAQGDLEKALALDATNSEVQRNYAALMATLGRLPEAIGAARKSVEFDPLSTIAWVRLGRYLTANAQYAAADAALRRALALQPDNPSALIELGTLRLAEDNAPEALATFLRVDRNAQRSTDIAMAQYSQGATDASERAVASSIAKHANTMAYQIAEVYAWRGQSDAAFEWLERAYKQRDPGLCYLKFDPLLDAIRHDARYAVLLRELKLPE